MIDKILRVAVAGVQAARSGMTACVFKSNPTKILYKKGFSVALLGVIALSLSPMASATLITVEADVLENTGSSVTFAQFDQSLGTLTEAHLTYNFAALYYFYNDGDAIAANHWLSGAYINRERQSGQRIYNSVATHGSIAEGSQNEVSQAWVTLTGEVDEALIDVAATQWANKINFNYGNAIVAPGLGEDLLDARQYFRPSHTATATMFYTYNVMQAASPVPTPPTLALFTLGLLVIAARRVKARKYR